MDNFENHINKTIDGRYQIKNVVGVGGMAYVLMAEDLIKNCPVAIKILSEEYNSDENAVKRFINESRAVSMLHHKNIVTVYDVAINDNIKYIVMEFIDGITLKDYMSKKGILNWREAVDYTIQILEGLAHAHSKGVIHRDIKPQNIMLRIDGTIKVTDFGIAKIATNESLTMTDKAIGTVNYISPEQASGSTVTIASDLYAVGVMLYEMITGVLPFLSESPVAVATMHVSSIPTPPREKNPHIPVGLEQIILKVMNKKPSLRFSSADNMIRALKCLLENPNTVFSNRSSCDNAHQSAPKNSSVKEAVELKTLTKSGKIRGSRSMFPIVSGFTLAFFIVVLIFTFRALSVLSANSNKGYNSIENEGERKLWGIIDSVFLGSDSQSHEITVPALIGKTYTTEFETELLKKGFRIANIKYVTLTDKPVGTIINQSPEENAIRKLSSNEKYYDITITINKETESIAMPDLKLMTYSAAKSTLIGMGVSRNAIIKEDKFDDSVIEGYVISTTPIFKETYNINDAQPIKIYVSAGQKIETTVVPNLVDLTLEIAKRTLLENNLAIGTVTFEDSDKPKGTVLRTSVVKDTVVPQKLTKIDLFVSLGNLEKPLDETSENTTPDLGSGFTIDENGNIIYDPEKQPTSEGDSGFYADENGNIVYKETIPAETETLPPKAETPTHESETPPNS